MTSPRTVDDKFDDAGAFPEIRRLRKAVNAGTWKPVAEQFATLADDHARAVAIRCAAEVAGSERLFTAAAKSADDALPMLLLAARNIELAWHGRTHNAVPSTDHLLHFRDRLQRAEVLLIDVCAVEPENVPAWGERLTTAMGLGLDPGEQQRRYDALAAHNPHQFTAQWRRMQMLCPKWGGEWDSALAFTREVSEASSPGSLTPALIPAVHLERWLAADGDKGVLEPKAVQSEVAEAAQRSVLHRDFTKVYRWVQAHSYFALYYSLIDKPKLAARHFREMGTLASAQPWTWFADGTRTIATYRKRALGEG